MRTRSPPSSAAMGGRIRCDGHPPRGVRLGRPRPGPGARHGRLAEPHDPPDRRLRAPLWAGEYAVTVTRRAAFGLAVPALALAQGTEDWPNRTIRLIVAFAAGGAADTAARTVGQKLAEILGQSVVIENR